MKKKIICKVVTEGCSFESGRSVHEVPATDDEGFVLAFAVDHHIPRVLVQIDVLHVGPFLHEHRESLLALLLHQLQRFADRIELSTTILRHHSIRRRLVVLLLQQPSLRRAQPLRKLQQQPAVNRHLEPRQQP